MKSSALFSPWEISKRRSWAIGFPQGCVYVVGAIFCKGLITLELAGCIKEHKNLKAFDKNINPWGFELQVDNVLVFTRILKAADCEHFLYKIQFTFFTHCVFKRMKLSLGYLAVLVSLLLLSASPRHQWVEVGTLLSWKDFCLHRVPVWADRSGSLGYAGWLNRLF